MILNEILEPGEIQVRPQPDTARVKRQRAMRDLFRNGPACPMSEHHFQEIDPDRVPGPSSLPGYQILGTCKQAYEEGAELFYTKNTFYLPPGPIEHSITYFNNLAPATRALIKSVGIRFGIEDLAPVIMPQEQFDRGCVKNCEKMRECAHERDKKWKDMWESGEPEMYLNFWSAVRLRIIWTQKIRWVREWDTVQTLKLEFMPIGKTFDLNGKDLMLHLADVDLKPFDMPEHWPNNHATRRRRYKRPESVLAMTSKASDELYRKVQTKITAEGWPKCREWIIAEQKARLNMSD